MSDRELATAIWVAIAVVAILRWDKVRESLKSLIRAATQRQILLTVLLATVYVWGSVLLLERMGLWDSSHVYKTWIWIFSAGLVGIVGVVAKDHPVEAIKDAVAKNVKLSAFLTFVLNANPFPLLIELILLPALFFLAILQVVAESQSKKDAEYEPVKKLLENSMAIFGFFVLAYVAYVIYREPSKFFTWQTLHKFMVPIELSTMFAPLIYFLGLMASYERLFVRLDLFTKDNLGIRWLVRLLVLLFCNINIWRVVLWSRLLPGLNVDSASALLDSLRFKRNTGESTPPATFRGLDWGNAPASYMKLVAGPHEDGSSLYSSPDWPPLPQFGYAVAEECYGFQHGRLYQVMAFLDGRAAFNAGRYELQARYGPASFANERGDLLKWKWGNPPFEIQWWYQRSHDRATLVVTNEGISADDPAQVGS